MARQKLDLTSRSMNWLPAYAPRRSSRSYHLESHEGWGSWTPGDGYPPTGPGYPPAAPGYQEGGPGQQGGFQPQAPPGQPPQGPYGQPQGRQPDWAGSD